VGEGRDQIQPEMERAHRPEVDLSEIQLGP